MSTVKRYEILDGLPAYGPRHISVSSSEEKFYSEGFVVRFYKDDGTDWVANFKPGWTNLKQVIELNNSSDLLIIALGECYVMNPNSIKPISAFGGDYSEIFKIESYRYALQDSTGLTILEPDGTFWDTGRISMDGLKNVAIENNIVTGLSYNPITTDYEKWQWIEFSYDLNTKILTGGSYNWHTIEKKPWWKIW